MCVSVCVCDFYTLVVPARALISSSALCTGPMASSRSVCPTYIHIHMYIYMYTHTHTRTHTHTHTYVDIYIHVCVCVCVSVNMF